MAVADRHSERVGGVIGLRDFFEIEDYPRHLLHLLLFGASVTDDALFDLQGCILKNRDTVLLRCFYIPQRRSRRLHIRDRYRELSFLV